MGSLTNHLVTLMFNQMLIWFITVCQVMRHDPGSHMEPVPVTLASHAFFSSATEAVPKARLAATAINTISCHPGDDQQRQFVRRSKQESIHCSKPFMRLTNLPVILLASAKMKDVDRNKVPVWIRVLYQHRIQNLSCFAPCLRQEDRAQIHLYRDDLLFSGKVV